MTYEKTTWETGDIVTAQKLNNIENGIKENEIFIGYIEIDYEEETVILTNDIEEFIDVLENGKNCILIDQNSNIYNLTYNSQDGYATFSYFCLYSEVETNYYTSMNIYFEWQEKQGNLYFEDIEGPISSQQEYTISFDFRNNYYLWFYDTSTDYFYDLLTRGIKPVLRQQEAPHKIFHLTMMEYEGDNLKVEYTKDNIIFDLNGANITPTYPLQLEKIHIYMQNGGHWFSNSYTCIPLFSGPEFCLEKLPNNKVNITYNQLKECLDEGYQIKVPVWSSFGIGNPGDNVECFASVVEYKSILDKFSAYLNTIETNVYLTADDPDENMTLVTMV